MRKPSWQVFLSFWLIVLSTVLYYIHFLVFRDLHHISIYMLGDLAFLPIEVLLVTIIIDQMLAGKEKEAMGHKMNMVIGAFFSEVGNKLLEYFRKYEAGTCVLEKELSISDGWTNKRFHAVRKQLKNYSCELDLGRADLDSLRDHLVARRNFLLRLLENPNLLEHDTFTELLWSVFHLTEELEARKDLKVKHEADMKHLAVDIKRAYYLLIAEWIAYMRHLKSDYPYLYSMAVRTNPFDPNAAAEVS